MALSISDSKALLNMNSRSDQRAIYGLKLFVRPYNQIRHIDQAVCPYCEEHFDIYPVHYICVCPVSLSQVHRSKLLIDVPSHMYNIDNAPLTLQILRRQGARRHKELIQLILYQYSTNTLPIYSTIKNMHDLVNVKGVMPIVGMVTYTCKCLPNLSSVTEPLRLQHYSFNIVHTPGTEIPVADALSRFHSAKIPDAEEFEVNVIEVKSVSNFSEST